MAEFTLKEVPELDSINESSIRPDDDYLVYDESVGIVRRVSKAQSRLDRPTPIDSVASFASIDLTYLQDRQQFSLLSFRPDNSELGGLLYWAADLERTSHDGKNIYSPTVPAPTNFNSAVQVQEYLDGVGEAFPGALGCFVRIGGPDDGATFERQIFTATAGQQIFNLTEFDYVAGQDPSNLKVYVNGIFQMEDQIEEISSTSFRVIAGTSAGDAVYASTSTNSDIATAIAENYASQAKDFRDTTLVYRNETEVLRDETEDLKDLAEQAFDNFDDVYLGAKEVSPATDNDGDPLQVGALYFQSVNPNKGMKIWDGSSWVDSFATITISSDAWPIDTTQAGVLSVNTYWYADTSSERTRDLPAAPTNNDEVIIVDNTGLAGRNTITIGRNGNTIMGLSEDFTISTNWLRRRLKYNSGDWRIVG